MRSLYAPSTPLEALCKYLNGNTGHFILPMSYHILKILSNFIRT